MDLKEINEIGNIPVNNIIHGDCIEVMNFIPSQSIDCIITDLPYG